MKLVELYDEYDCDECDEYTSVFLITFEGDEAYPEKIRLCKKCLLKLLKLIIER